MREINSGKLVTLDSGHQPLFLYGLDANKSSVPTVGDSYYATDTLIAYTCYVTGTWTSLPWGMSQGRRISQEELIVVQGTWEKSANALQTDTDPVFVNGTQYYLGAALSNTLLISTTHNDLDEIKIPNFRLLPGTYLIQYVTITGNTASGIIEVLHGTTSLGTFDSYNAGGGANNVIVNTFYTVATTTVADLRFRVNGKNAGATGFGISFSRIEITRQTIPRAASAPAYVKGAVYFDTTLNKLCVGGAAAWETITSAP